MKVFITKYALTKGILEKEVERTSISDRMVNEVGNGTRWRQSYHKPHWHETKEEAVKHAEEMRVNKIDSLKKQITKLEKKDFNKIK
jgi:hypothetical protein